MGEMFLSNSSNYFSVKYDNIIITAYSFYSSYLTSHSFKITSTNNPFT